MPQHHRPLRWQSLTIVRMVLGLSALLSVLARGDEAGAQAATHDTLPLTRQLGNCATIRFRGRIDADSIWTSQSAANMATFGDLGEVVGLRRAWLGAEGNLGSSGRYITEIDLASGFIVPRDVFVGFNEVNEPGERRAGHFLEPFSLELGTNSNFTPFMEQSPVNLLDPARNWGFALFRANGAQDSTLAIGAFHAGTDDGDFQGGDGSTVGFTGRWTIAPINEGNGEHLLHLGVALSERVPEHGVIIVSQQPRNPLLDLGDSATSPFVPTIRISARFQQLVNLQMAWVKGPLWAQTEWYGSLVDQATGGDVFFHGGYAEAGYFLTGEHRTYQDGVFTSIRVDRPFLLGPASRGRERGWGAWEVAARFAYLDFMDSDSPIGTSGQFLGLQLPTVTFGVTWYLADHLRLLFNYNYEIPNEPNTDTSVANIFGMRLNVSW